MYNEYIFGIKTIKICRSTQVALYFNKSTNSCKRINTYNHSNQQIMKSVQNWISISLGVHFNIEQPIKIRKVMLFSASNKNK